MKSTDVAIIGGGVGGLSAAMYSRRFNLDVTLFDGFLGGTVTKTDKIENYPGFLQISGIELAEKIREQALFYNPNVVNSRVDKIEKKGGVFVLDVGNEKFEAKTVILATGTEWKKLGVKGEKEFVNRGVHYCALCDANFYRGKVVTVVGAGDAAVKNALVLSGLAEKVYIITRKEGVHPEPVRLKQIEETDNIEVIPFSEIVEIVGDKKVTGVKLSKDYEGKDVLDLDGVFIDIGHVPLSGLAEGLGVELDDRGYVVTNKLTETNVPGFFAVGDVTDTSFRQAINAAAEGCKASYSAYEHIKK